MIDKKARTISADSADSADEPDRAAEKIHALYPYLIESLTDFALFAISIDGTVISWNSGAQQTFGYTAAEILGFNFSLIFTPEDNAAGAPATELRTALSGAQADHDRWHVRKDGTRFWGTNTVQPMYDRDNVLLGFAKLVHDITSNYLALQALSDSEEHLRLLIESVHEYAIFSVALDGTITSWNDGARATFGFNESEIVGRPMSSLFTADDIAAGVPSDELREATLNGYSADERWLVRKDSTRFLASCKLSQLKRGPDARLRGFVNVAHDVTERKRIADDLRRLALSDQLTALPNRTAFYQHVNRSIALMKRRSTNLFAVLFIDLDHFKTINDTYGHIVADRLLEFTARRLEHCVRSEDIIARLGGDEFAILVNGITEVSDVTDAGNRIGVEMSRPVVVEGIAIHVTASVGIALGSVAYEKPEDIIRDADTAMYAAKTSGRARSVIFEPALNNSGRESVNLESDLRHALEREELRVEYQPIVALATGATVGFEALVRWQHPRRGLLQPAEFIPKAEETNAIIPIDRWVFRAVCEQLNTWKSEGLSLEPLTMSVNFSSKQFSHPNLIDDVRSAVEQSGLQPGSIHIEITESAMMERSDITATVLQQIRALGLEIHIDDFGIGYSSLGSLGHLPVSGLKIDRSFVAGMNTRRGSELVRTVVLLAHNFGLVAVAEGLENAEQLKQLTTFKCDFAQGNYFSKPLGAQAAGELIRSSKLHKC